MIEINMNLVYTIINVIILYLLLRHFLIKPVTDIMEKRKQLIADGLQSAQDAQDGALKMKQEYEAALNGAKQESVQIVENARKSAKAEYDRILEEAGNKADSMIASAKETIRIEREKTIHELKGEITGLAIASAAKIAGGRDTEMKTNRKVICSSSAVRYAETLFELNIPKETIEKTREIFSEVPQITDVLDNPTIRQEKKEQVIDKVFPREMRNFLKIVCRYRKVRLLGEIFDAYDMRADEEQIIRVVLFYTALPSEEQKKGMESFLCRKYGAKRAYIEMKKDDSLIGGFILRVGNDEYDRSTKGRLDRLEQRLTRR